MGLMDARAHEGLAGEPRRNSRLGKGGDSFFKKTILGRERVCGCLPTLQRLSLGLEYIAEVTCPRVLPILSSGQLAFPCCSQCYFSSELMKAYQGGASEEALTAFIKPSHSERTGDLLGGFGLSFCKEGLFFRVYFSSF